MRDHCLFILNIKILVIWSKCHETFYHRYFILEIIHILLVMTKSLLSRNLWNQLDHRTGRTCHENAIGIIPWPSLSPSKSVHYWKRNFILNSKFTLKSERTEQIRSVLPSSCCLQNGTAAALKSGRAAVILAGAATILILWNTF